MTDVDITANYHRGDLNSVEAFDSIADRRRIDRARILAYVWSRKALGATCDEAEVALGLSHQTASARFSEAKYRGDLVRNGHRRPTRSGRLAAVFVVPEVRRERVSGEIPLPCFADEGESA